MQWLQGTEHFRTTTSALTGWPHTTWIWKREEVDLVLVTPVLRGPCDHPYAKSGHTGQAVVGHLGDPSQPQQIQL